MTHQKRLSIKPTAFGWICLFFLVWIPLAAVVTGNNFLFIIFSMTVGLVVVSHWLAKKNIGSVLLSRKFPDEIFAGTPFTIRYVVHADGGPWGAASLTFYEGPPLEGADQGVIFPQIPPGQPTSMTGLSSIAARGDHSIEPGVISSLFPFGLARYSRRCGTPQSVLVFPAIEPVDSSMVFSPRGAGTSVERTDPFGTIPHYFRDYVPGDPFKHIDWKKSARTGEFVTRILSDEGAQQVVIRLPQQASEKAISRAASLVVHFDRLGVPVSLEAPGLFIEGGVGPEFTLKLLVILARWEDPGSEVAIPDQGSEMVFEVADSGEFLLRGWGEPHETAR
ncbi:MAG: DUF58 domain-containing protein [Deltaproteobacteria bacterium]